MLVLVTWTTDSHLARRVVLLRSSCASGTAVLSVSNGHGELRIQISPRFSDSFIDPRQFASLGLLAVFLNQLPTLFGVSSELRATAVSERWLSAQQHILSLFRRAGLLVRFEGRSLVVSGEPKPSELLQKVAVLLFALDGTTQLKVSSTEAKEIRAIVAKQFASRATELLQFMDGERGNWYRSQIFGPSPGQPLARPSEELLRALKRLGVKKLIQFDCGRGRFLRHLAQELELEEVIGVEPSLSRYERAKARLVGRGEVHHGSLTEAYAELPDDALALVLNSLPAGSRLREAEESLFRRYAFQWVLCIESGESEHLQRWAESVGESFGYRHASWLMGNDTALLFRREEGVRSRTAGWLPDWRQIETSLGKTVRVQLHQWRSCTESFSKWIVDPRFLMYLPAGAVSMQNLGSEGPLEHPEPVFDYYRAEFIPKVVAEYKHMGSRAIAVVCQSRAATQKRFGGDGLGCIYTRTGRPMLEDHEELLEELRDGLAHAKFWERMQTDWVCLDGEMLPWTLKAEKLFENTHKELLAVGQAVLQECLAAAERSGDIEDSKVLRRRLDRFAKYGALCTRYDQETTTPIRFAPFHLIATEGRSYFDKSHVWHMTTLGAIARRAGPPFIETPYQLVNLHDEVSKEKAARWWSELSASGQEGMVIKPLQFIARGRRGFVQPMVKCRGEEHLRLVYGPEYDLEENRLHLTDRQALMNRRNKHRRVLKQFALSVEAVERFVRGEPTSQVLECVRGVMALETREA